jgi:hypothetical protein
MGCFTSNHFSVHMSFRSMQPCLYTLRKEPWRLILCNSWLRNAKVANHRKLLMSLLATVGWMWGVIVRPPNVTRPLQLLCPFDNLAWVIPFSPLPKLDVWMRPFDNVPWSILLLLPSPKSTIGMQHLDWIMLHDSTYKAVYIYFAWTTSRQK